MDSIRFQRAISEIEESSPNFFLQEALEKNSSLHLAVKFNQKQCCENIINSHPQLLYHANSKGDTPLHIAARSGCMEITELITSHLKTQTREVEAQKELLRMVNLEKDTALHDAVRNGHFEIAKLLIEEDPELARLINENGDSPLFLAVDRKHFLLARYIVDAVPRCSYQGRNMNALHAAIIRFPVFHSSGEWFWYLRNPILFIYKVLITMKFASVHTQSKKESDIAEFCDLYAFVWAFVKQYPDAITEADEIGWTPLHYAAYLGNVGFVFQFLREKKRDVAYLKDREGMSALHIAANEGHQFSMQMLLEFYPETSVLLDNRGRTVLHVAAESGKTCAVTYILKTPGLDGLINEQDKGGNTPLHLAAVHGHLNIVHILTDDSRVDKGAINKDGFAAIDIILSNMELRRFQKAQIIMKLQEAGAPRRNIRESTQTKTKATRNVKMEEQLRHIERKEDKAKNEDSKHGPRLKDTAEIHLLVATIIATVSFAAGFTMPGGFESQGSNQGMVILSGKLAFGSFVIADTIAFCCSAASMVLQLWASIPANYRFFPRLLRISSVLTLVSIMAMVTAFVSGTNVVLARSHGLVAANLAIGCCFFLVLCAINTSVEPTDNAIDLTWSVQSIKKSKKPGDAIDQTGLHKVVEHVARVKDIFAST